MAKTLVYQLYPLSWSTGFKGMTNHLKRIADLRADYVWLSPVYRSPFEDGGYDVANYMDIDRRFGKTSDFKEFIATAHDLEIGVVMDLPINHTSIRHRWFDTHPEYYCWSKENRPRWRNLFNNGPAWQYLREEGLYYLHLFHETQADLNWFPNGGDQLNWPLVHEFQHIIEFWVKQGVDGFRLDFPQGINKDFASPDLELDTLLFGNKAQEVINAIFEDHGDLFLMMECFDPTMGDIVEYYADNTPVDFVCNVLLKDEAESCSYLDFYDLVAAQAQRPQFMLELESHDSPRFLSRGITLEDTLWCMFDCEAEGICIYQGQELGLKNPTKEKLPDDSMLELDAQTAMRYVMGEDLDKLRPTSRANSRIEIPLDEYEEQEQDAKSPLNQYKDWIIRWLTE